MNYDWFHLVKAIRFYHWRTFIPSLDLSETVPSNFEDTSVWPEAPASKIEIINDVLSGKQDLIEYNIKQWQNSLPVDAVALESEAMRQGIRFFLDKIFYPPATYGKNIDKFFYILEKIWKKYFYKYFSKLIKKNEFKFNDYQLEFVLDNSHIEELLKKTKYNKNLRIFMLDGLFVILIHRGKIFRRMSPLIVRLLKLYNNSLKSISS
jgi:hypothetical protein